MKKINLIIASILLLSGCGKSEKDIELVDTYTGEWTQYSQKVNSGGIETNWDTTSITVKVIQKKDSIFFESSEPFACSRFLKNKWHFYRHSESWRPIYGFRLVGDSLYIHYDLSYLSYVVQKDFSGLKN